MIEIAEDYEPFDEMLFCSNKILGGGHLILINAYPILLIGRGVFPLVWLSVPIDIEHTRWKYVVEKSISVDHLIEIKSSRLKRDVKIFMSGQYILKVTKTGKDSASVDLVDFTRLGYDIIGDQDGLRIGKNTLSRNVFEKVDAMITVVLGNEKSKANGQSDGSFGARPLT